jgi:hypothetical protein
VIPVTMSCTNTSVQALVSPPTRLLAPLSNATKRPEALIEALEL